jgi:hypothetical protein
MPHTFGNDERVAAQDDRDVMVPAGIPAAFVVVEPQLALEILIGAFDSPALHHPTHQLLLRQLPREGAEEAVGGFVLAVAPFDQQPHRLALIDVACFVVGRDDAPECESGREILLGPLTPSAAAKPAFAVDTVREIDDADDLIAAAAQLWD